jgi:hypothetical protein
LAADSRRQTNVLHAGRAKQVSAKAWVAYRFLTPTATSPGDFHEDGRLLGFREFVSKHAFSRYRSQKTQVFVKRTALFREEVGRTVSDSAEIDEEIHALCEALVASEGRLGP